MTHVGCPHFRWSAEWQIAHVKMLGNCDQGPHEIQVGTDQGNRLPGMHKCLVVYLGTNIAILSLAYIIQPGSIRLWAKAPRKKQFFSLLVASMDASERRVEVLYYMQN